MFEWRHVFNTFCLEVDLYFTNHHVCCFQFESFDLSAKSNILSWGTLSTVKKTWTWFFFLSDINECLNSSLFSCPGKSRICENIPGNYTCKCQSGLFYINNTCTGEKRHQNYSLHVVTNNLLTVVKRSQVLNCEKSLNWFSWDTRPEQWMKIIVNRCLPCRHELNSADFVDHYYF